jgi:hypothetical protein
MKDTVSEKDSVDGCIRVRDAGISRKDLPHRFDRIIRASNREIILDLFQQAMAYFCTDASFLWNRRSIFYGIEQTKTHAA